VGLPPLAPAPVFEGALVGSSQPSPVSISEEVEVALQLLDTGVPKMERPALSRDLNPIENLWDQLSRRVEARNSISRLVNRMRRRCQAVIDAQGHMKSY